MPQKSIVFDGKLPNGVVYKIHNAQGFTKTHSEIAIEISGQFVLIATVIQKKSGNIDIIPTMGTRMTIHPDGEMQEVSSDTAAQPTTVDPQVQNQGSDLLSGI